jgi:hypothetical protein
MAPEAEQNVSRQARGPSIDIFSTLIERRESFVKWLLTS